MSFNKTLDTRTFAIVILAAVPNIETIHDRMPVILKNEALAAWINPETSKADALVLLRQNRGTDLVFHPVGKAVGNVRNKGPELIDPIEISA